MISGEAQKRLGWTIACLSVFLAIVGTSMLVNHFQVATHDPLTSQALGAKKDLLRDNPASEELKQEIRDADLRVRQIFFRHLTHNRTGAWLLLGGLAALILSARTLVACRAVPPAPQRRVDESADLLREKEAGRRAVAATTLIAAVLLLLLALLVQSLVPAHPEALAKVLGREDQPIEEEPTLEEIRTNWPQFRGPTGDGVATTTNIPTDWNGATGDGVAWKSPVPLPGFGSPIVWRDRVFLAGGDESTRAVFCFSAMGGRLLWQGNVPAMPSPSGAKLEIQEFTGVAASTPATDGRRVFAIFASGELVAFNFDGRLAWSKHLGVPENPYGFATSLIVHNRKLIVQYDQGQAEDEKSRLYAFDTATGRVAWEQPRAMPSSWTTPIVFQSTGRTQLVALSQPWAVAYDPANGRELWRADCLGSDTAPSPVYANDLLYVVHPNVSIVALRVDGSEDVTETHIAWQYEDGAPDITSPVTDGQHLFALTTWGVLTCLDSRTGTKLAEKDLEMEFNASPVLLGDRLLLVGIPGVAFFISANPALEILAQAEVGESVHSSPALVDGRLYLRGKEHLHAIGQPPGASPLTHL